MLLRLLRRIVDQKRERRQDRASMRVKRKERSFKGRVTEKAGDMSRTQNIYISTRGYHFNPDRLLPCSATALARVALFILRCLVFFYSARARTEVFVAFFCVRLITAIYVQRLVRVAGHIEEYRNTMQLHMGNKKHRLHRYLWSWRVHLLATLPLCTVHVTETWWTIITTVVFPSPRLRAADFGIRARWAIFPAGGTTRAAVQPRHQRHVGEASCDDQSER